MDSWTLQGDSYSFLHSAPCTPYSLIHRDGSPNHVEIFDIISSPIQHGAISETTCLCDIFGDDCESPSLSSSPAVGAIVHSQTEAEGTTAASPPLDDLNESSGSYHTAPCSSEGEEGLDDQVDKIHSPLLQGESCKPTIECSELSKDSNSSFESKGKSLLPQISSEVDTVFGERTPSPGHNSSSISSLSSSCAETRCPRSVNHQEQGRLTPRNNNPSHQSLTQSPSLASMNCNIVSSLESVNSQSEVREAGVSPGPTPTDCSSQSSNVDSTSNLPFDFPSPGCTEGQSEDSLLPPELNNTPSSLNTPSSSPFPELGGRVSFPDLMSRGSTPDIQIENSIQNSELLQYLTKESTIPPENLDAGLHAEFASGSRPAPRYTPPSPGISFIPSHVESGGLPELKHTSPSPDRLGAPSMNKSWSRTSSPGSSRSKSASSEIITAACSPVISYSLSPSPGIRSTCSSIESTHTAPSPEIRITASSPKVKRRECMSEEHSTPDSLLLESSRSNTSSPHITGNSYSDGDTSLFPELRRLSTPEPGRTDVSPDRQSPASNRQLEREKRMQLEEERERRLRGIEGEKGREGWEEWHKDASYRGEQVELSFNAKNRNGPTSRSTAPTSRESRQGLPTVHSYSESLPATTEPQEQKSLLKLASQQDKGGCPTGRLQPSAPQNKISARSVTNRPGRSSSSSMGSELDEADNEVKWLTDVAFRSLSSPEVDYLDMYNSSHRSSTNISQPSTQESPAGVSGVWPTYADFRGSASKLENDEYFFQQQPLYHSDGMDPSHPYEMGSFECIDVAVEREESKKMKRGVPKRQIQLKKKESKDDSSENKSPGMLAMENSTLLESHSGEVFLRQYSTPAEVQECYTPELCHEPEHNERKNKLQKSVSLDETSSKTKMATCLIKSILSKKMQGADKQPDEPDEEEVNTTEDDPDPILYSNPSKDLAVNREQIQRDDMRPVKSNGDQYNTQSSISSNRIGNFSHTNHKQSNSKDRNTTAPPSEIRSQLRVPLDSWQSKDGVQPINERKTWQESDSTNANTGDPSVTRAYSTPTMMTSQQQECEHIEVHKQLQQGESRHTPKGTQDAKLKNVEKKKASLNVCLTPEAEKNPDASSPDFRQLEEKVNVDFKIEDDRYENNKVKGPIHKVRDVRRLVKNTYNLSFKATMSVSPSDINEEKIVHLKEINEDRINEDVSENVQRKTAEMREETNKCTVKMGEKQKVEVKDKKLPMQSEEKSQSQLHPMQIQCKAVCWREDKNNIVQSHKDSGEKILASAKGEQTCNSDIQQGMQEPPSKGGTTKSWQQTSNMEAETQKETESEVVMRSDRKPPMLVSLPKLTSKEREVSTAVVLIRDASRQEKTTQEDFHICPQAQAATPSPEVTATGSAPSTSSHSVSMLLKEKGYQADIGAVMGDSQNSAGGKGVPRKHVNCLEIPFQTPSDGQNEPHREKTLSSSSTMSSSSFSCDHADKPTKTTEDEVGPTKHKNTIPQGPPQDHMQTPNKQKETEDFEGVKRQDSTFPPKSPVVRRFRHQPIEVKSLSKETITKQEITTNSPKNNRSQTIEFKSIAKNTDKPIVPPKPTCKFIPADFGAKTNEVPFNIKPQSEERSRTIVVSSPTIYRKIPTEASSTSNQTRKLAVSTVSSLKPPPSKITTASISSLANQSATEASRDRDEQQSLQESPARSVHTTTATSAPAPSVTSTESDPVENQVPELPHASQRANTHEATLSTTSSHPKPPAAVSTTGYIQQQYRRSLSSEHAQRTTDLHLYASDDPPSYDERESFSPLMPDLTSRRSNRYQNPSHPPPCSCTAGCPPPLQPALPPLPAPPHHHHHHHHHSPHNLTPPHSPGHVIPHHAPLRPHQYRADPQPVIFQPSSSPKSSPLGPSHPPAIYQPLHQPPTCPPNPSIMPVERPMPIEPRRLPLHRSPQQQPPGMPGAPYSDPGHSHSPGLGPIDPQYLYGSEYGGDSSSLYSESHFGQTPRRVLLDPETGKYFYIEVPMQPLRKMLFDPETGQYVEVLIPQQAMSHSGVYPSSAAPYSSLHNPNMYGPAPQYMPYAAHPPPAHPHPQPPRYPEVSASATMHPNGPSGSYRSCSGQGSKPEPQSHPPLDQSYLDGMYYVPTGMNASANTTPSVYHHKHPSSLPPSGGKRS
ncbi:uncharacterized protein [Nerophis lumbriciformis]|uniref:uncharacterized protein n=1 Tax=Nerophis lumbriciformis TaxID=546530 RepID=UPI003BAD9403